MEPHAAAYEAWLEAERSANAAERALGDEQAGRSDASPDLMGFVRLCRREARVLLVRWLREVEKASPGSDVRVAGVGALPPSSLRRQAATPLLKGVRFEPGQDRR